MISHDYVRWFRDSTPYISAHRGRTFVVLVPSDAIEEVQLTNIVHDLALLHVLGVRLVVVHGSRAQIDRELPDMRFVGHRRVTDAAAMQTISRINGQIRTQFEALFSMGLPATPMHNTDISVVTGNLITARPVGVIEGVDHELTGRVRRVHTDRIEQLLNSGAVVLSSPVGYSPSGQAYNLAAPELAGKIATALQADKLIILDEQTSLKDEAGHRLGTLTPGRADQWRAAQVAQSADTLAHIEVMSDAVRSGVARAHLIGRAEDGALLGELFTASGVGTQISEDSTGDVRPATVADVADIVEIIRPLEESGALIRRSRDRLEAEISHFYVAEVDGIVVGTCALYPHGELAELACVAVKETFQNQTSLNIGSRLVQTVAHAAVGLGASQLFILTTQAEDWFLEQGFARADRSALPAEQRALYNDQRASKVMMKQLSSDG